jgi:hypothetical protein
LACLFFHRYAYKKCETIDIFIRGWGRIGKETAKEGLVKLDRNRHWKVECTTLPYSNDSQNIMDGWLVSSSTGMPTKNAKPLTSLLEVGDGLAKRQRKRGW